jgi:hypothetical protein
MSRFQVSMISSDVVCPVCKAGYDTICDLNIISRLIGKWHYDRVMLARKTERDYNKARRLHARSMYKQKGNP